MGRVDGKVAFITGAARGQGRSHAVRLAQEGADIIAIDALEAMPGMFYPAATKDDLAETVQQVEALGRRIIATQADVRYFEQVKAALDDGVAELGHLDIVCANAGIQTGLVPVEDLSEDLWVGMMDVNLNGVWRTCKAAIPHLKAGSRGGSIIITSSVLGLKAVANVGHYNAAKHGVIGLMRTLANELGQDSIRVNSVAPSTVGTLMVHNETLYRTFCPDLDNPTSEDFASRSMPVHSLPIAWVDPVDISNAVLFLASDEARYVTGIVLPVDAGFLAK